jgi:hypothetical protein
VTSPECTTNAWLLQGLTGSVAGWLVLADERLRFITPAEVAFDVALSEVTAVVFPWYYFGGGMKLRAGDLPVRISFVKPNGAEYADARLLASDANPAALLMVASKATDIRDGQTVGRRWRELLESKQAPLGTRAGE